MAISKIDPDGLNIGQIGGRRNLIINGAMQVAQRGTSTSTHGDHGVDRFKVFGNSTSMAFTATQDSDAPNNFINSLKYTVTTAATAASGTDRLEYLAEGYDTAHLNLGSSAAQTFTLSFYVKSSVTGTYAVAFHNASTTRSYIEEFTVDTANTWEQKTITITGDTSGTWLTNNGIGLFIRIALNNNSSFRGTADAWQAGNKFTTANVTNFTQTLNATFQITGVQLEVGNVATPFEHRSYGEELALCQRYYHKIDADSSNQRTLGGGIWYTSTQVLGSVYHPVYMRSAPTAEFSTGFAKAYSRATARDQTGGNGVDNIMPETARINFNTTDSGTQGDGTLIQLLSSLAFDAEL